MAIPFLAVEISGLATQTYNSGAVNRKFIEDVSGAIWSELDSLVTDTPTTWSDMTTSTGLTPITVGVSGSAGTSVEVLGYSTISSNAQSAHASTSTGVFALQSIDLTAGAGLTGGGTIDVTRDFAVGEGTGITVNANDVEVKGYSTVSSNAKTAYDWFNASAQALSAYQASGDEYSAAYASAQALKQHAFHAKISSAYLAVASGWASIADNGTIAHGLSSKPSWHIVAPSGAVTFAIATTVDATNITVRISAAGSRMVSWRAEV